MTELQGIGRRLLYAPRQPLPETTLLNADQLADRADAVVSRLEETVETLEGSMVCVDPLATRLRDVIRTGDVGDAAKHGLNMRVRFDVVGQALISGRPFEAQHLEPRGIAPVGHAESWDPDAAVDPSLAIGGLLRSLMAPDVALRHNITTLRTGDEIADKEWGIVYALNAATVLKRQGALRGGAAAGTDLHFGFYSDNNQQPLQPLTGQLGVSRYGTLKTSPWRTTFMPHAEYVDWAAAASERWTDVIRECGVSLLNRGYALRETYLAANMLGQDPNAVSITTVPTWNMHTYWQAYLLSRFAGRPTTESHQLIGYNPDVVTADLARYGLARFLLPHVRVIRNNIGRFAEPEHYAPGVYNDFNYGSGVAQERWQVIYGPERIEVQSLLAGHDQDASAAEEVVEVAGILPEDILCRSAMMDELYVRYPNGIPGNMADVYCGPANSLPRIFEPFLGKDAKIHQYDRSPGAIDLQHRWKAGTLGPESAAIGATDENFFTIHETKRGWVPKYSGVDNRARARAKAFVGDSHNLPPNSYGLITDGYGSCSSGKPAVDGQPNPMPPSYDDFVESQAAKYHALLDGGVAASFHMVRRTNWEGQDVKSGEPIELPSIYLSDADEIKRAYQQAGFINVKVTLVDVPNPHHPGAAMAVVVADKPKAEDPIVAYRRRLYEALKA